MSYLFHTDPNSAADDGDEFAIQVKFLSRMKSLAPSVRCVAAPNGMKTTAWGAQRAKAEGMRKGEPDLKLHWQGGSTIVLEFKKKGGSLSPDQVDALNWYHKAGFPCGMFRSVDTALDFVRQCGAPFLFEREAA